jgi:hypothetical protein
VSSSISKDLLIVGKGGNITLEEKLLLKGSGELSKYSFTPQSPMSESKSKHPSASTLYSQSSLRVYESKPRAFIEYITELKLSKEEVSNEIEKYLSKQELRFQNVVNNIKSLLQKEKVKNRKLTHAQAKRGAESTKTEMMTFFQGAFKEPLDDQIHKSTTKVLRRKFI